MTAAGFLVDFLVVGDFFLFLVAVAFLATGSFLVAFLVVGDFLAAEDLFFLASATGFLTSVVSGWVV